MTNLLVYVLYGSLLVHIILVGICVYRVWRGENIADRLIGSDLVSTLAIAIFVLIAMLTEDNIYLDVALGLTALGFIAIVALSKFATDEEVF